MKTTAKLAAVILLFCATVSSGVISEGDKFSVTAIHAHLYYQSTGKINPTDLLDGKAHALWNSIIGEGEALMPSRALWVLVDLAGPTFAADFGGRLVVCVTEGEKILLNQTLLLDDWFSEGQKLVLPFLIYGTGCGELEITATLEGLPDAMVETVTLRKKVPFKCGE